MALITQHTHLFLLTFPVRFFVFQSFFPSLFYRKCGASGSSALQSALLWTPNRFMCSTLQRIIVFCQPLTPLFNNIYNVLFLPLLSPAMVEHLLYHACEPPLGVLPSAPICRLVSSWHQLTHDRALTYHLFFSFHRKSTFFHFLMLPSSFFSASDIWWAWIPPAAAADSAAPHSAGAAAKFDRTSCSSMA